MKDDLTMRNDRVKTAFERVEKVLKQKPSTGQGTARTRVHVRDGLSCQIEDGQWSFAVDMSKKHGGDGEGPDPGVYGRGAVGSCMAICYLQWAAKLGIPIDGLEVEVQADYDVRGHYGIDDVPAGYSEMRFIVKVDSVAPEEEILRLLDLADRHSPWLQIVRRPIPVKREVRIAAGAE